MTKVSYSDHLITKMRRKTGRNVRNNGAFGVSPWPPDTGKPGSKHLGVDIAGLLEGTPIPTWLPGEILHAGRIPNASASDATYGNTVFLWPDGYQDIVLLFAHAKEVHVKTEQRVKWGQEIYAQGGSGAKGLADYGIHTHLEVRKYEKIFHDRPWLMRKRLDPEKYLFLKAHLEGESDVRTHCVVGFSEADAPTLLPIVQVLRRTDDCPIYFRNTMSKGLANYETIHAVGGGEDFVKEIKALAPAAKINHISGPTRLETAVAAWDWWAKNK
jgi:hypothetical protein